MQLAMFGDTKRQLWLLFDSPLPGETQRNDIKGKFHNCGDICGNSLWCRCAESLQKYYCKIHFKHIVLNVSRCFNIFRLEKKRRCVKTKENLYMSSD